MKIQTILAFCLFAFFCFNCKNEEPKTQQNQSTLKNQPQIKTQTPKDTLFEIKYKSGTIYTTSVNEPEIVLVGVLHYEGAEAKGVHPDYVKRYDEFWKNFLKKNSFLDPEKIRLAIEFSSSKPIKIGTPAKVKEPMGFITDTMFRYGIRNIVVDDPRKKTKEDLQARLEAGKLFAKKGGQAELKIEKGFPVYSVVKEPEFTSKDLEWLKNNWYTQVYKEDIEYETQLYKFALQEVKIVVGAAHIYRMKKEKKLPAAFICGETELKSIALGVCIQNWMAQYVESH